MEGPTCVEEVGKPFGVHRKARPIRLRSYLWGSPFSPLQSSREVGKRLPWFGVEVSISATRRSTQNEVRAGHFYYVCGLDQKISDCFRTWHAKIRSHFTMGLPHHPPRLEPPEATSGADLDSIFTIKPLHVSPIIGNPRQGILCYR